MGSKRQAKQSNTPTRDCAVSRSGTYVLKLEAYGCRFQAGKTRGSDAPRNRIPRRFCLPRGRQVRLVTNEINMRRCVERRPDAHRWRAVPTCCSAGLSQDAWRLRTGGLLLRQNKRSFPLWTLSVCVWLCEQVQSQPLTRKEKATWPRWRSSEVLHFVASVKVN